MSIPYMHISKIATIFQYPQELCQCMQLTFYTLILISIKTCVLTMRLFTMHSTLFNVYCPECPPGGTIGYPGGQHKKFLPFGHGRLKSLWYS